MENDTQLYNTTFEEETKEKEVNEQWTIEDLEEDEIHFAPASNLDQIDTYSDQTPHNIMGRICNIASFTWNGNQTFANKLMDLTVPLVLFSKNAALQEKASGFRFLECDVEITIRINSTQLHTGALIAYWLPNAANRIDSVDTITKASLLPHLLVNATSPVATTFTIPLIMDRRALMLNNGVPLEPTRDQTRVVIRPVVPLNNSQQSEAPSVNVIVQARLIRPKLSGLVATKALGSYSSNNMEVQMESEPTFSTATIRKRFNHSTEENQEAKAKSKGTLGTIAEVVSDVSDSVSSVPIIGSIASVVSPIAKTLGGLFDWFGWQNPLSEEAVKLMRIATTSTAQSRGLSMAKRISMAQTSQMSGDRAIYKSIFEQEENIKAILMRPYIFKTTFFNENTPANSIVEAFKCGFEQDKSYQDLISRCCGLYRGGFKFKFLFYVPMMTQATIRIFFIPRGPDFRQDPEEDGNVILKQIDLVGGMQEVEFTVPYLTRWPYLSVNDSFGSVQIRVVIPPVVGTSNKSAPIYIVCYKQAAEDMEMYRPWHEKTIDMPLTFTKYVPEESREEPMEIQGFDDEFPGLAEAEHKLQDDINFGESLAHMKDFQCRYHEVGRVKDFETDDELRIGTWVTNISTMFCFNRVGRRIKLIDPTPGSVYSIYLESASGDSSIREVYNTTSETECEIEAPRLDATLFSVTRDTSGPTTNSVVVTKKMGPSSTLLVFIANSDDSSWSLLGGIPESAFF